MLGQLHAGIGHSQAVGDPTVYLFDHKFQTHGIEFTGAVATASALEAAIQSQNLDAAHAALENTTVEVGVKIPF